MAPSIPTHRPLLTAARLAALVAVVASASSLYLAFGGTAWAGAAVMCLATAQSDAGRVEASVRAPE
jgi:hypothetical protein